MTTFSNFKKDFYNRIGDGSLFDCGEINLLKVVLDGLRVGYADKGNVHTPLFGSLSAHKQFLFVRRVKMQMKGEAARATKEMARAATYKKKDYLVIDHSARVGYDEKGKQHSLYFDRVVSVLKGQCVFVMESEADREFDRDVDFSVMSRWLQLRKMTDTDISFREQLRKSFARISDAGVFSYGELNNIRAAIQLFFDYYRSWYAIVDILSPRVVIFGQHYHREGLLLAIRQHGILSVELQHGLIAPEDIFYLFPFSVGTVIHRALFADRILVYGDFWKNRLRMGCEYPEDRIGIIGYYHFESDVDNPQLRESLEQFKDGNKLLLVTTQTSLHRYFIDYLEWLSDDIRQKNLPWKIVVKPHPAENKGIYDSLMSRDNIRVVEGNLEHLFPMCDVHLSIYSTTLFDAIRYGKRSYALYVNEYGDYVNSMIEAGVAEKTEDRNNFLQEIGDNGKSPDREQYYAGFNPQALITVLR